MTDARDFACDVCGSARAEPIACAPAYTKGQAIHVCLDCGFVYVRRRRSAAAIAASWSDDLYQRAYTARIPAVRARHRYVADTIDNELGLRGKRVVDIGAGEGHFLELLRGPEYGAEVFGIEPSAANCQRMAGHGIAAFAGTIEDCMAQGQAGARPFDIATILWTLENCQDCRAMLTAARALVADGGHVVVATGSRILVPFKKPLHYYLGDNPADTHCFRFTANSLSGLLRRLGLLPVFLNRYIDSEYLVAIGKKTDPARDDAPGDDPAAVLDFFRRWDAETRAHFADA